MISIEAYRASIGSFDSTRQFNLRAIFSKLILGSHISNRGALRLFKLVPFFAVSVYMFIVLLIAGDVETNPGPIKIIQGFIKGILDLESRQEPNVCVTLCGLYVIHRLRRFDFGGNGIWTTF